MLESRFSLELPSGDLITYEEIFSPFEIYVTRKHLDVYILIPKPEQESLQGIVIIGNATSIRICKFKGWPRAFVPNIRQSVNCCHNNMFSLIDYANIPTDIQDTIASKLIKHISYKPI